MERKKVIDGDNNRVIEYFDEDNTFEVLERYKNDGRWEDVGVDVDGDIVLWEEL